MVMGSAHSFSYRLLCRLRNDKSQAGLKVRPCFQRKKRERGEGEREIKIEEGEGEGRRRERTNSPGHLSVYS